MRLFTHSPLQQGKVHTVTVAESANYPQVQPTAWNAATWSIVAIVVGGKHFSEAEHVGAVSSQIEKNYDNGKGTRHININLDVLGRVDPLPGRNKASAIFYQIRANGQLYCATGMENQTPCMLTDRLMPDVRDPFEKQGSDTTTANERKALQDEIARLKKNVNDANAALEKAKATQIVVHKPLGDPWMLYSQGRQVENQQHGTKVGQALGPQWNGVRTQMMAVTSRKVLDFASNVNCTLYGPPIHGHENHTLTLERHGSDEAHWWMLTTMYRGEKVALATHQRASVALPTHEGQLSTTEYFWGLLRVPYNAVDDKQHFFINNVDYPFAVKVESRTSKGSMIAVTNDGQVRVGWNNVTTLAFYLTVMPGPAAVVS